MEDKEGSVSASGQFAERLNPKDTRLPLVVGLILTLAGIGVAVLAGIELAGWILLILGTPLLFEGGYWWETARIASVFYTSNKETFYWEAYDPKATIPSYVICYGLLFLTLIVRELDIPLDTPWVLASLVALGMLYGCLSVMTQIRIVKTFARSRGIKRSSFGRVTKK